MRCNFWLCLVGVAVCGVPALAQGPVYPTPPAQAQAGPGGRDYAFERVRVTRYGKGAEGYWVFEPRDADKAEPLPVVVYLHGLNATHYAHAWLWIQHLVRKGNLVVFPQYQEGALLDPQTFTDASAQAIVDALQRFDGKAHAKADHDRFALVGHSLGGTIAANLAARHEHYQLPRVRALMAVQPGDVKTDAGLAAFLPSLMHDHRTIPRGTLMLVIAAENDNIVGQAIAKRIFDNADQIPKQDKDFLLIHEDRYGRPALIADHFVPSAYVDREGKGRADAYDFALWRWFDALSDTAFGDNKIRKFALGNTPEQRAMGNWSDGRPVREPTVTDEP